MLLKRAHNQHGFNLIEAAIVLGVVGLIIGGVWAAAASVMAQNRVRKGAEMLTLAVQQVRAAYTTRNTMVASSTTGSVFTTALINAELLPREWTNSTGVVINPWRGNFLVTPEVYTGSLYDGMNVSFSGIDRTDCLKLAANIIGGARAQGLYKIDAQAVSSTSTLSALQPNICNSTTVSFFFSLKMTN